jgi:hypothetical protein
MSNTIVSTPLGDSLRALADLADEVPALEGARVVPAVPQSILVAVRTGLVARALADDFGVRVSEYVDHAHTCVHTSFEVERGAAILRVYAIDNLPRELRRPVDVTEQLEATVEQVSSQAGLAALKAGADL